MLGPVLLYGVQDHRVGRDQERNAPKTPFIRNKEWICSKSSVLNLVQRHAFQFHRGKTGQKERRGELTGIIEASLHEAQR